MSLLLSKLGTHHKLPNLLHQVLRDRHHQAPRHRRFEAPRGHPGRRGQDKRVQEGVSEHLRLGDQGQAAVGRMLHERQRAKREYNFLTFALRQLVSLSVCV